MSSFYIPKTLIQSSKVNIGLEKTSLETSEIRLDINFELEVDVDILNSLAIIDDINYQETLFKEDGAHKDLGIGAIKYDREYDDQIVYLYDVGDETESHKKFECKKIWRFSAEPTHSNHVELKFQIQFYVDGPENGWYLMNLLTTDRYICIDGGVNVDLVDDLA